MLIHFDTFTLEPRERRLTRGGEPIDLSGRYLDALLLLVDEAGSLVTKDRFMTTVWQGIPVTDEALTQCIRSLRRTLGDDAEHPRFIATVPRHGYRFVAPIERREMPVGATATPAVSRYRFALMLAASGIAGGGLSGAAGGLVYGALAANARANGIGGASALLVVLWLSIAVAVTGAVGVSIGIAVAGMLRGRSWIVAGGAIGGFVVGGVAHMLGLDAFNLLLGHAPVGVTGAGEGFLIGGTVGLAAMLARNMSLRRTLALAVGIGGIGGALILAIGGRMMIGSLQLLATTFPESQLRLDFADGWIAAHGLASTISVLTGALEGGLFTAGIVGAMTIVRKRHAPA